MQLLEALNYMGPNRRFDTTAIEILVTTGHDELRQVETRLERLPSRLSDLLRENGIFLPADFPDISPGHGTFDVIGSLFCQTSILLQRHAGHEVKRWALVETPEDMQRRWVYEHEERTTGEKAGDITLLILAQLLPGLEWQSRTGETATDPAGMIEGFIELAAPLAMPRDTLDIMRAAKQLDVPCLRLERDPYSPLPGPHRIRDNSLLMLGHGRYRQIIDGTVCVTRSHALLPYIGHRESRIELLRSMGLAVSRPRPASGVRRALMAGQQFVSLADGGPELPGPLVSQLEKVAASLPCGMLTIQFSADENEGSIEILDVDFAPRLDVLPGLDDDTRQKAAKRFIGWIFPPEAPSRIPVIAVTGTNGKSTTTAMIEHVMRNSGLKTGMAYSSGIRINGITTEHGDVSGLMGHYRVFESPEPEVAILETARGGVLQRGFAFNWCNIGVCLNVQDDHLGQLGVETLEDMARIKRSIVARARDAVVLNADDSRCLNMIPEMHARRICLVSTVYTVAELREIGLGVHDFCVLEDIGGKPAIVYYRQQSRTPVVPVGVIPATGQGRLMHNVINAVHAAAVCLMHGLPVGKIRPALQSFHLDAKTLLGRWNELPGLPFTVIFDYAHNTHGVSFMVESTARYEIEGMKRIVFAMAADRGQQSVRSAMSVLKNGFDRFLLTEFEDTRSRPKGEMLALLRTALIESGVDASNIQTFETEEIAVQAGLEASAPGDLLMVRAGKHSMQRIWEQMCAFRDRYTSRE